MNLRILCLILALASILSSCIKSTKTSDPSVYSAYINGFTRGVIGKTETVKIKLARNTEAFKLGDVLPESMLTFDPAVKGTTILYSENMIVFTPQNTWPAGKTIAASLDLGELLQAPDEIKRFDFQFSIIKPSFTIYSTYLYSSGTKNDRTFRVEGRMLTADVMNEDEAAKLLSATDSRKNFPVSWSRGIGSNELNFSIDSLPRRQQAYTFTLAWDGNPLGIDLKGEQAFEIPAIGDFIYLDHKISQGESQYIDIILSDPVDPMQDLKGLVYLREDEAARVIATNNVLRLYPSTRLEGQATLVLEKSLRNDLGNALKERVQRTVFFEELKPAAEFIGQGVVMPDPQGLFLPVRSVSLRAFDVIVYKIFENNIPYFLQENDFTTESFYNLKQYGRPVYATTVRLDEDKSLDLGRWNTYSLDLSPLMDQDPAALYRVKLFFRKEYAAYGCNENETVDISKYILDGKLPEEKMKGWDGPGWYNEYEWPDDYRWNERDNPCHNSYYTNDRFEQKLIMASQIGVSAKSADGRNFQVFTTDLNTGEPLPSVEVSFFNYQNQFLGSLVTSEIGMADGLIESRPFMLKASSNGQQTWMRVDDGNSLSMSHFDIDGEKLQQGLKGMIYGERGVWRPGDTLHLAFILDDSRNALPTGHPALLELSNARGQLAFSSVFSLNESRFHVFHIPTDDAAPTGTWRAKIRVGGSDFEKSLRIETVKPNRLKIKLDFTQEILNAFGTPPEGRLEVKWLHGASAAGIKTEVNLSFRKKSNAFKGYEKYTFDNPASYFWSEQRNIFNQNLDQQGKASFRIDLPQSSNAPGMMEAVFWVRAFEKGGDVSTDVFTRPYSPFRKYVGIRVPEGGSFQDMLETDKDNLVELVSLNASGNPLTSRGLEVKVYKLDWRWWWNAGEEDLAYYVGSSDAEIVFQTRTDVLNGKGSFTLRVDYPDWGRYLILVKDPESGHQAGLPVYFDWPAYVNRSGRANPAGATMLSFSADKEKYEPGDKAVISFPATPGSRALVCVESGSRIISSQWKICSKEEETFEFNIEKGMAPNVYVNLSLIQPHKQTQNDLPIRMYGVIPVFIEDQSTILSPVIKMPAELKPGESFTVSVSEKNNKPMTFTLAMVDEGLLDLTRFRTPDPHSVFYAREALGVKTWDMYDLVLGAYGGRLEKVLAIGGDEDAMLARERKAQRFEPVVRFAGPFTIGKGEKKDIPLDMPEYVGSVRTMVVAGHDGAYGHAETTTPVKKALMVLATLPRVIGPEEEFDMPVSVFAMDDKITSVVLKAETGKEVQMLSEAGTITFEQVGEKMAYFRLKAGNKAGIAKIRVTASSGNESASYEVEIAIRNPNPMLTKSVDMVVEPGQTAELPYAFFGMEGTGYGQVTLSGIPSFDLDKHLNYLIRYPYGCLEQTVSSVFPQLFLADLTELSADKKMKTDRNIKAAINKIAGMALADGSFTYWPGQSDYNSWTTSYAGHFLYLAAEKGYLISGALLDKWLSFQHKKAGNYQLVGNTNTYWDNTDQAYRLYTLALAQKPNTGAMNRMRESGTLTASQRWILAAAYLYAGKPEVAEDLVYNITDEETDTYEYAGPTYGSALRDRAFTLETFTMLKKDAEAFRVMQSMAEELRNNYYPTQTTAFSLYALSRYIGKSSTEGVKASYRIGNEAENDVDTDKAMMIFNLDEKKGSEGVVRIMNKNSASKLFVNLLLGGQPLQGQESPSASGLKINVVFKDLAGSLIDIASVKQGTDIIAEVSLEHPGLQREYNNLALSQVFPSGWEIINTRIQDLNSGIREDEFEYRDYRDDRVNTFFDLRPYEKKTFRVMLNAAYPGRYYLPAWSCEAMYDANVHANTKGYWVTVVR